MSFFRYRGYDLGTFCDLHRSWNPKKRKATGSKNVLICLGLRDALEAMIFLNGVLNIHLAAGYFDVHGTRCLIMKGNFRRQPYLGGSQNKTGTQKSSKNTANPYINDIIILDKCAVSPWQKGYPFLNQSLGLQSKPSHLPVINHGCDQVLNAKTPVHASYQPSHIRRNISVISRFTLVKSPVFLVDASTFRTYTMRKTQMFRRGSCLDPILPILPQTKSVKISLSGHTQIRIIFFSVDFFQCSKSMVPNFLKWWYP